MITLGLASLFLRSVLLNVWTAPLFSSHLQVISMDIKTTLFVMT